MSSFFQVPSLSDLVQGINDANSGAALKPTDVVAHLPVVTGGTWNGQPTDRNTALQLSGASPNYQGQVTVLYNRLDLAQLANFSGLTLSLPSTTVSVYGILPQLRHYLGIPFTTSDLQDTQITVNGNGTGTLTLRANTASVGWFGTVSIPFTSGGVPLNTAITQGSLSNTLAYPTADAVADPTSVNTIQGPFYLAAYDFSSYYSTLSPLQAGTQAQATLDALAAMLNAVDTGVGKSQWVSSGSATAFSLSGATIVANQATSNNPAVNPGFKFYIELKLATAVTQPAGSLIIQYSQPLNATNF